LADLPLTAPSSLGQKPNNTTAAAHHDEKCLASMPRLPLRLRILFGCVVSIVSFLLTFALIEGILRLTWDRNLNPTVMQGFGLSIFYEPDAEIRWRPKPNLQAVDIRFDAPFTTNSRGLRGRKEYTPIALPGVKRIVVLGDSFTWGYGVADDEVFAEVLASKLSNTEVINLGVSGHALRHELRYLDREGMRYHPCVVVVALCMNDIHVAPKQSSEAPILAPQTRITKPTNESMLKRVKKYAYTHTYVYGLCAEAVNANKSLANLAVKLGLKEELAGYGKLDNNLRPALIDYPNHMQKAMAEVQADLLRFKSYLDERNIDLVVALIPSLQAVDHRALMRSIAYTQYDHVDFDLDKPYHLIREFAKKHGITVCHPLESFRTLKDQGETLYLKGDMHFNAKGHRVFAESLVPLLSAMLSKRSTQREYASRD